MKRYRKTRIGVLKAPPHMYVCVYVNVSWAGEGGVEEADKSRTSLTFNQSAIRDLESLRPSHYSEIQVLLAVLEVFWITWIAMARSR